MSSTAFSAELRPDPSLRRIVYGSGVVLGALGTVTIAMLPWPPLLRVCVGGAWIGLTVWDLARLRLAWADARRLRLRADGVAKVLDGEGRWCTATVLPGGILLRRWGWIRVRAPSSTVYAELVRGSCRNSHDWRRLQVIWRHVGGDR